MVRMAMKSTNSEVRLPGFNLSSSIINISLLLASLPLRESTDWGIISRIKLDNPCKVLSLVLGI